MSEPDAKLTQKQIDAMFNEHRKTGRIESAAIVGDGNKYICIYCRRKEIVINEWEAPWIFGGKNNQKCKSLCGHTFISLERLKMLQAV